MIWSYGYCLSCQEDWAVSTASYSLPVICLTCGEMLDQYAQINFLPIMKQKAKKLTNTMLQHQEYCKESLLTNLSDSLLLEIGSYLHPLDSYHLGITTKKLHVPSTEISTRHFLSPLESNPLQAATLNCVNNVASRIVQESLIHGLARALSHSCNCYPLDMAKQLVKLQIDEMKQGRKVLLSGLALVQTVTGKYLNGRLNLDFFCTTRSLPAFRTMLLNNGYVCTGAIPHEEDEYNDNQILHIETYTPNRRGLRTLPIARIVHTFRQMFSQYSTTLQRQDVTFFNYRNLCLNNIQKGWRRIRFPNDFPFTYSPRESESRRNNIQLFVCRTRTETVLARNDLEICRSWFDGKRVQVVSAKDAFSSRSSCFDHHIHFINEYVPNFISYLAFESPLQTLSESDLSDDDVKMFVQAFIDALQSVSPQTQQAVFGTEPYNLLDHCSSKPERNTTRLCIALHNKLIRLLKRALDYIQLGVHIPISNAIKEMFLGVEVDEVQ